MASGKSLQVEVVSHEGRLWHGAALSVQFPTVDGSLGVLPGRQPLLAQLGDGTVTCHVFRRGRVFRGQWGIRLSRLGFRHGRRRQRYSGRTVVDADARRTS